jgi:hypothetical protein
MIWNGTRYVLILASAALMITFLYVIRDFRFRSSWSREEYLTIAIPSVLILYLVYLVFGVSLSSSLRTPLRRLRTPLRWLTGLIVLLVLLWFYAVRGIGPNYTCRPIDASIDRVGRYLLPWCNWQPRQSNEKSTEE